MLAAMWMPPLPGAVPAPGGWRPVPPTDEVADGGPAVVVMGGPSGAIAGETVAALLATDGLLDRCAWLVWSLRYATRRCSAMPSRRRWGGGTRRPRSHCHGAGLVTLPSSMPWSPPSLGHPMDRRWWFSRTAGWEGRRPFSNA